MWSFVNSKKNEVYIWLAIDRNSRKIIGCFLGDRTRKSARKLWNSLPDVYQQFAFTYPDFWQAYKTVIPAKHHRAVGKGTDLTNHVERLNNTFRQRVSRLVRESLSFSKKLNNSLWGNLVLHSWLQCRVRQDLSLTTTSLSLPENAGSFRDFVDSERVLVAPVLSWQIGEQTNLSINTRLAICTTGGHLTEG
jgi:IS1 family transposase